MSDKHDMNHPMCQGCWNFRHPDRVARRVITDDIVRCCFCRRPTSDGIFVRTRPNAMLTPHCPDLVSA